MDSTDEPQKKIFKARKTMKACDRQQLEAVHKVKEDSLNAEVKLMKCKYENGDSDASLNDTDCMADTPELNGMLDIGLDPNIRLVDAEEVTGAPPSVMENRRGSQDTDFTSELELLPTEMICEQEATSNLASTELGDPVHHQTKDIHLNAGNGTYAEGLDLKEKEGSSLCGSERSCVKDFIEEQIESESVKTDFLSNQSLEETVLPTQPEESTQEKQMVEELSEAQPEEDSMKDQEQPVEEQSLQEPLHGGKEVARDSPLVEKVLEPQQKDILAEPEGELAEEPQLNVEIPAEPQLYLTLTDEVSLALETQLAETAMEETSIKGKLEEEPKGQELVKGLEPEMGPVECPQLKVSLTQQPQMAVEPNEPRSEQERTEDQLLEEQAEERQFREELAEDNLLDEIVEDQLPKDVLKRFEENSLVEDEQVVREEVHEEKLDVQEKTEERYVGVDKPEVMVEKQDLGLMAEVVEEKQGTKGPVEIEPIVEKPEEKDLKQTLEEKEQLIDDKAEEIDMDENMEEELIVSKGDNLVEDDGEEAITSSMEIDQDSKVDQTTDFPATAFPKPLMDQQITGCDLENADSMEAEDIIPILEKLAPAADRIKSFSKPVEILSRPEVEDQMEISQSSPARWENSETLPSEVFLLLSDEEDPCAEEVAGNDVQPKQSNPTEKVPAEVAAKELDALKNQTNKEQTPPERSEATRRKRSKSEDMDDMQSKRRRYEGEEYEAEIQVKITTRADVDQKLQKVIQRLLEEKLCALQCADFDRALEDLKTRVQKIECKKHEGVLNVIQAKIARLSKRFGAAKEDMKKRQKTLLQPVLPRFPSKAAGDGVNSSLAHRNVSTVRQILESKRNVGDVPSSPFQAPTTTELPLMPTQHSPQPASSNQTHQRIAQTPSSQSPITGLASGRPMPDWKLIQQRINATHLASPQTKPQTPVTSAQVMTPVISSSSTAAVVGTSQVSSSNDQPVSVSLQSLPSLPVILHLPVKQSSMQNTTVMQSTSGTLVTNQQSGNVEFIPSQIQANVENLQKTPVSLPSSIAPITNTSTSLPSPTMQRNSPASAASLGPALSAHGVSTAHSAAQGARTSLPAVSMSGQYSATNSRTQIQMKVPSSTFTSPTSSDPPGAPRESQLDRTPATEVTVTKRAAESTTQSVKARGGGVIDLTLDDEDGNSSQGPSDARKSNSVNISVISQPPQIQPRPSQPLLTAPVQQNTTPAQTTLNVNQQRPMTQAMPQVSTPRASTSQQLVYTTLPSTPIQTPVRCAVMQGQNQGLRQVSPQTGGGTFRMPQTTAHVVNNGMTIRSGGPPLTVHHRPSQEPLRFIHPAPLPEAPQPLHLPPEAARTSPPQKPHLKLARVQSQNGIVLSWSVLEVDHSCASADSYHLYAYHEDPTATTPSHWKKIGEVKALPLPMACTLTQFVSGSKYYFAVRAKDAYGRFGVFCDPQSTDVIATPKS